MWAAIRGRWQWRYDCTTGLCWREDSWHTDGKDLNSVACCVCYFIYCFAVIWSDELSSVPTSLFKKKKDWKLGDSSKVQKRRIGAGGGFGSAHIGDKQTFSYRRQLDFSGKIFCCYRKFKQRPKKNCDALRNTLHPQRAPSKLNRQNYRRLMTI